ncbi:MAG: deoxyribodipyrimidine photo-lyase, partial [Colwellia sp.]
SGISPYLAAGVISPRYVLRLLLNKYPDLLLAADSEEFSWLNEIIWREFYRNLLFHEPRLSKHQCYKENYQDVRWDNDVTLFNAWCQGKTGYPLVDAAMRQLNQTGWMHNRLRMVVASFLTKHLLIDWRLGEKYFMQHLIDGDLASNNGGWQWAASTGCDAQPYFRIFNPIRQSERFDPTGIFIRKYIPELKSISDKAIHFPHQYIDDNKLNIYWPAIVEHKEARLKALAFYKV